MKRLLYLSLAAVVAACTPQNPLIPRPLDNVDQQSLSHGMIVLGERLNDPYTVQNMTKALQSLYPTKAGTSQVPTTDYYVRFLPQSDAQYSMLESLGVELIDHPLDYRIVREGDYYQDPSLPEDSITWQYAVVDADFDFPPAIKYEILDKCYIAEHDRSATKAYGGVDWEAVEKEAYRLTGNEGMLPEGTKADYPSTSPSGRITIVDDMLGGDPIGVSGVRVSCNTFVKTASAFTDKDGNYRIDRSFTTDVRYRLVFKNTKGFCIGFNLLLAPASNSTLGKNSPEGVSVVIDKTSDRKLFTRCVVNNAAFDYWQKCEQDGFRINTPPGNLRIWLFQNLKASSCIMMQQGAIIDGSIVEQFLGEYTSLLKMFLPDITMGLKGAESYSQVYTSATHELAHASHFMQVGKSFWNTYASFILTSYVTSAGTVYGVGTETNHGYCEVGEMWAYYVQTKLYRERYNNSSASFGGSYWFSPQILLSLDDRGLDRFKIFKAFEPDVTDKDKLQDRLISLYPESKSLINQAFGRYN